MSTSDFFEPDLILLKTIQTNKGKKFASFTFELDRILLEVIQISRKKLQTSFVAELRTD